MKFFNLKTILQLFIISIIIFYAQNVSAQLGTKKQEFTHSDSLRGMYSDSRDWWDVLKYDIYVNFDIPKKSISGKNIIQLKAISSGNILQIDLQDPMIVDSLFIGNQKIKKSNVYKDGNAYFINFEKPLTTQNIEYLTVYFHGNPKIANRPPWDGGLIIKEDKNKNPFVSIACQGLGASVWYPCKDHQADEPDSAELHIGIPNNLVAVSNGRQTEIKNNNDGTTTYSYKVTNPINSYNIVPYIGKYVHFSEKYAGEKSELIMNFWVLDYNLEKAKEQFKQAAQMMKAFEHWFGPYPFYEDGYKLVESPYLGMEHQSAIAYGNGYENGYLGKDLSGTGWGKKFDFIIIHESGHEWFANNITTKDIADMWVHESFTNYSEVLFLDYFYGKEAGNAYAQGIRKNIANDIQIIGTYNVNKEGSGDMYYKGANMIHNIRQIINDDEKFRKILRGLNSEFYHKTVTGNEVEEYINKNSGIDFSKVFDQYLRTTEVPTLECKKIGKKIKYRYTNTIPEFSMPLKIYVDGKEQWISPSKEWKYIKNASKLKIDSNFFVVKG